jgi:hypothetical protein
LVKTQFIKNRVIKYGFRVLVLSVPVAISSKTWRRDCRTVVAAVDFALLQQDFDVF